MVRPISSKRKLFNNNKDQFKENEPDQVKSKVNESFSYQISSSHISNHKSSNKKTLNEKSSREKKFEIENNTGFGTNELKKCSFDNGANTNISSRTVMPMSERQQIALVMQLSSPSPTNKADQITQDSPQTPTTPLFGRGLAKRNERGETLLHVAAIKGDRDKVAQLISQGANVNATDYAGWTALHEACNRGFLVIASLLIKGAADVNAKGLDNDTPLHDACINNHYQIVRLLLISGAKPDSVNCRGKSPIDVCRSPKILSLLEEAKLGKLQSSQILDKGVSIITVKDLERSLYDQGFITINNNCPSIQNSEVSKMSRKTPPNNKPEEKLSPPVSAPSPVPSSTSSGVSPSGGASSGVSTPSSGNGRPISPRVTMRLAHGGTRTPDKPQTRPSDNKPSSENEDVYEFRCSKDESKDAEIEDKSESSSKSPPDASSSTGVTSSDTKGDKRPRDNENEEDEEFRKKRRKEDNKEGNKATARTNAGRPSSAEKTLKSGQRSSSGNGSNSGKQSTTPTNTNVPTNTSTSSNAVTSTTNVCSVVSTTNSSDQKKSPSSSACNSPKPTIGLSPKTSAEKSDSDNEDVKSENNSGAPKVPPLKIVLAPCSLSEQETSSSNGKNTNNRQLPYVVNSSSGSSEEKEGTLATELKEVAVSKEETTSISTITSNQGSPTSTTAPTTSGTISTNTISAVSVSVSSSSPTSSSGGSSNNGSLTTLTTTTTTASSTDKGSATRITRSQRGGGGSNSGEDQPPPVKPEPKVEEPGSTTDVVHPRKRKIKMKEPDTEPPFPTNPLEPPVSNCYEMYLKIRKQIERRRKLLFPVQPKPPQGFKDYLMNRCSYVLANNANSQLSVPVISPPASLTQPLKDLFSEQEQERYKLKLQQLIEKEKLVLSVEQEILRVHGRAARALANQVLPFSVCTILKDEEIYNVISPEQEEKDRNARSRYNGRLFLSWLQDVDDKWEKIKEAMVLRHHNEVESLHAVQKMDWEWKLKELGVVEPNTKASIDELHVPMVQVADFDLLPA